MRHVDGVYYFDHLVEAGSPKKVGEESTVSVKAASPVTTDNAPGELPYRSFEDQAKMTAESASRVLASSKKFTGHPE